MELEYYELPAYWASALINGDESGLTEEDEKPFDSFVHYMIAVHGQCWCVDVSDDESGNFKRWHDATEFGGLPCDVATFTFDVTRQKQKKQA